MAAQLGLVLKDRADLCLFLSNRARGDVANLDFISGPLSDSDRWCVVRLHVCWEETERERRRRS